MDGKGVKAGGKPEAYKLKIHRNQSLEFPVGGTSWDLEVEITPSYHEQHKINSWTLVYAYRTKQTNKNPAGFYSDGTRDLVSSGRKRVSSEDTTATLLQGFMAGYLPASFISGHCSLTNMGQFHFSSTRMGENSQYVCALRCSCNSFFHLLDSIKDTKVWENQVWPKWSSKGSKNALREPQFTWLHLAFLPLTPSPPLEWVLHCCHSLAGLLLL